MSRAAAFFILLLSAGCQWVHQQDRSEDAYTYNNYGFVPPADPNRRISERDCTRPPAAPDNGNLRCT
jgi:hypothetical protein